MAGMDRYSGNMDHLVRSTIWSSQLKEILLAQLQAKQYVDWLSDFPDGDTFKIPSIGQAYIRNFTEGSPIVYDALDTGEFQFSITEYLSSATYITEKAKQDSYYASQLIGQFVPKQARAIEEHLERAIWALSNQQTLGNANSINGAAHRMLASGSSNVIAVADFAKALYALKKANVPDTNLIAIVDPSVEYTLNTLTNLTNVQNNPRWEGVIDQGLASGYRFVKNVYGFDVYTSNFLPDITSETIGGSTITNAKANIFFSAASDVLPFKGAWRQMPTVYSEFNKDQQREEYVTVCRYGVKLFRPENLVVVLSNPSV